MAQILLTDPLQSAEDSESASSGGSEPTTVRSILGRYVKVVLYGPTESQKLKIWLNPNSTFADVERELLSNGHRQAILLQPKFGTMPYWSKADPNFVIANECRTLYALTISEEQPYLLGLVRTNVSDYPIAIFKPGDDSSTTVNQAIISAHPDLTGEIHLVSEFNGGVEDIKDQDLDFTRRAIQSLGGPTAFFITTNQSPVSLINGAPANSIPPCLQMAFVNCEYLLSEDLTSNPLCDAITHVLRATLHIIISVSRGLHPLFDEEYEDLQAALAADEDLSPLISVAPVLSDELISIMEKLERIINDRDTSDVNLARLREELLGIFTALCGDFPGAVAVRCSSTEFQNLASTRLLSQTQSETTARLDQSRSGGEPTNENANDIEILDPQWSTSDTAAQQRSWAAAQQRPWAAAQQISWAELASTHEGLPTYDGPPAWSPTDAFVRDISTTDQSRLSEAQLESIMQYLQGQSWYSKDVPEEKPPFTADDALLEQRFIKETDKSRFRAFIQQDPDRGTYSCRIPHITTVSAQVGPCTYEATELEDVVAHVCKFLNYEPYQCQGISGCHDACGDFFPTVRRREDHYSEIRRARKLECSTCGEMVLEHNITQHVANGCPLRVTPANMESAQRLEGLSDQGSASTWPTEPQAVSPRDKTTGNSEGRDEEAASTLEMRTVEVRVLSTTGMSSIPQISVEEQSTFEDIRNQLAAIALSDAILLQPHYCPMPYWTNADPYSQIPKACRVLYAVNPGRTLRYTLSVVRTSLEDYPVAIFDSSHDFPISVSNAVLTSLPKLADNVKSIFGYPEGQIEVDATYNYEELKADAIVTFPTVFFVIVSEPPETFLSEFNSSTLPSFLAELFEECKNGITAANQLKNFRLPMQHVSNALLHLVISLAEAIGPVNEEGNHGGETIFRALEFFRLAPTFAKGFHSLLHQVRAIMEALKGGTVDHNTISVQIDQIFNALCGEYPGALNIRQSYRTFRESLRHYREPPLQIDQQLLSPDRILPPVVQLTGAGYEEPDSRKAAQILMNQEGASNALIEKAFSELGEDSIWLTKPQKYSFADLSPLASQSVDDAILKTVRGRCRAWVKDELPLDLLIKKALRALLPAYKQLQSTVRTSEVESISLPADLNVTVRRICDVFATMDNNVYKIGPPIRVAVIGPVGSGKTTFINSLIGQNLLIRGGRVPILIQHVNGLEEPTLKINPPRFSEYFQHIAAFMEKARQNSKEKLRFEYIMRRGLLEKREQMNLKRFQEIRFLEEEYKGSEAIIEVQQTLNDLVKLCTILTMGELSPVHSSVQRPVLQVHMTGMELLSGAFEIIGLPAADTRDHYGHVSLLEQIHQNALLGVDGIITVIPLPDSMSGHSWQSLSLGMANLSSNIAPLLLVLGSMTDQQMSGNWSTKLRQSLTQMIFHDKQSPRFVHASPFMHIGAQHAIPFVTSIAEGSAPRGSLRNLKRDDPTTYKVLCILLGLRWWRGSTEGDEDVWRTIPIDVVLKMLEEALESSRYAELRGKLDEYVIKAGRQRRLLFAISELGSLVDQLQQALASTIRRAHKSTVQFVTGPHTIAFSAVVRSAHIKWTKFVNMLEVTLAQTVEYYVAEATERARVHLDAIVDGYFDRLGTRNAIMVPTMDDAINLFFEIEREVKKLIHSLQSDVVGTIRNNLRKASVTALQELTTMLKASNEPELYDLMQDLMHRLASLSVNSTPSQAENLMDTSVKEINDLGFMLQAPVGESPLSKLVVKEIDDLGFILRAPVGESTLSKLGGQSWIQTASSYPATLSREEVEKYFLDTTIDPWSRQIHQEGRSAIERVLSLAVSNGERCLDEFMTGVESETDQPDETPEATQDALILLRINVISSRELLRIFHRRLYVEIGKPDPLSHARLPTFLGETHEGID